MFLTVLKKFGLLLSFAVMLPAPLPASGAILYSLAYASHSPLRST